MPVGADGFRLPTVSKLGSKNKIECLPDQGKYWQTFVIHNEDHTLGNPLKHIIVQYPEVSFCGYTVPHPMENKIHLRIQCDESIGKTPFDVLRQGLLDLKNQNQQVLEMLKKEVRAYEEPVSS